MIPSTTAAVVVFVLLVSPGIAFELLWQRSRPRRDETAFVEISRVLLAGVAFSGAAALLMVVVAALAPGAAADLLSLVRSGQGYVEGHPGLTLGTLVTGVTIAVCVAIAAHELLTPPTVRRIVQETVWHTAFSRMAGPGVRVFLSVQLKNGTTVTGYSAGYSTEPDPVKRDLLLTAPLAIRLPGETVATPLADAWQTLVLSGTEIRTIATAYVTQADSAPLQRRRQQSALAWLGVHAWQSALAAGGVVLILHVVIALTGR